MHAGHFLILIVIRRAGGMGMFDPCTAHYRSRTDADATLRSRADEAGASLRTSPDSVVGGRSRPDSGNAILRSRTRVSDMLPARIEEILGVPRRVDESVNLRGRTDPVSDTLYTNEGLAVSPVPKPDESGAGTPAKPDEVQANRPKPDEC